MASVNHIGCHSTVQLSVALRIASCLPQGSWESHAAETDVRPNPVGIYMREHMYGSQTCTELSSFLFLCQAPALSTVNCGVE